MPSGGERRSAAFSLKAASGPLANKADDGVNFSLTAFCADQFWRRPVPERDFGRERREKSILSSDMAR